MIRKKMIVMACTLATCAMMSSMPVLADTASYNWKFNMGTKMIVNRTITLQ